MSDGPVRWGVIATGYITGHLLTGAREAATVRIEAIASRDAARAADVATRLGIPRSYGSYADLLRDDAIEAVYIAVPNSLHVDLAIRALDAGMHVLCEKPLTARAAEAARAFDVADGAIGTLERIRSRFSFIVTAPDDIRLAATLEGGSLMDIGCYCVNAARVFAGEPMRVRGEAVPAASGVDMRSGAKPLLGREDAVGQARAIEALLRSAATGAWVAP